MPENNGMLGSICLHSNTNNRIWYPSQLGLDYDSSDGFPVN